MNPNSTKCTPSQKMSKASLKHYFDDVARSMITAISQDPKIKITLPHYRTKCLSCGFLFNGSKENRICRACKIVNGQIA